MVSLKLGKSSLDVCLSMVGFWAFLKVFERIRSKGVHAGGKYKVFVDTEKNLSFYSQKQAVENGFKPPEK